MNRLKIIICAATIAIFIPILAVQANKSQTIPIQTSTISTNQSDIENLMRGPKTMYPHSTSNSIPAFEKKSTKMTTKSEVKSTTSTSKSTTAKPTIKPTTATAKPSKVASTAKPTTTTTKTIKTTTKQEPTTMTQTSTSGALYSPSYFRNMGVINWGGYRWTWYSSRILPGYGLNIPGRHTDSNGYICDGDGYICLANDGLAKGTVVATPFGKYGKVYDCGCGYSTLDVYVNW